MPSKFHEQLLDLGFVLSRRNVSVQEWLTHNEIVSLEEYIKRGKQAALEKNCTISLKTHKEILTILQTNANLFIPSEPELETKKNKKQQPKKASIETDSKDETTEELTGNKE